MRLLVVLLALAAIAYGKNIVPVGNTAYGYLKNIGVPTAQKIRKIEEELLKKTKGELKNKFRVVGGVNGALGRFPFQAGILIITGDGMESYCGGSLISTSRVVTAAHCWFDGQTHARMFTIVLGSVLLYRGGTRVTARYVIAHPEYNPKTAANDVAIAYLSSPVRVTKLISPIALPAWPAKINEFTGWQATASGFGKTSDKVTDQSKNNILNYVHLSVISNDECRISGFFYSFVLDSNICTRGSNGKGICYGDSGGPLTITWKNTTYLIGISSFGSTYGCEAGEPSVFAKVTSFLDFIHQNL